MKKKALIAAAAMVVGFAGAHAPAGGVAVKTPAKAAGVIDLTLENILRDAAPDEIVSTLIYLREQADIPALAADHRAMRADRSLRNESVVRVLMETAAATQGGVRAELEAMAQAGTVEMHQTFWLANVIRVDATPAAIRALARRADVGHLYFNPEIGLIRPADEPAEPRRGEAAEPGEGGAAGSTITPGVAAVRAPEVWAMGFTGNGVLVASLDTGVAGTHAAVGSRWRGHDPAYVGNPQWAWFDPVTNTTFPQAWGSHGTHTMGTVCGGAPGEQIGVAPGAQWIHAGVIDRVSIPQTVADAIAAFEWMADPDGNPATSFDVPHVCSNSWGVTTGHGYPQCDQTFWTFIDNSEAAGTIQLFSAGNEGPGATTLRRPADRATDEFRSVAVAAINPHNPSWPIAGFSSRGPTFCTPGGTSATKPDISAPGVDTRSALAGGGYGNMSGTSMASPHVNGVMALMMEACPHLLPDDAKQIIYDTAFDLGAAGKDNTYGYGMIDAVEAVLMAQASCGIGITLPGGAPSLIDPGVPASFSVRIIEGNEQMVPGSAQLFHRYAGGGWNSAPLVHDSGEIWTATLPAAMCSDSPQFYVYVEGDGGSVRTHPSDAPTNWHQALVGEFVTVETFHEGFDSGMPAGWTSTGLWNVTSACAVANPCDATPWAYYGQPGPCNYETGGTNSGAMVSAPITLPSVPPGGTVSISFCYTLQTEASSSYDQAKFNIVGQPATQLAQSPNSWTTYQFNATSFAGQTIQLRWHFDTIDGLYNNFRGWQVDNVRITTTSHQCEDVASCLGDLDNSGAVDVQDLLILLSSWGPCAGCSADLDNSGAVDVQDLLILLSSWGPCP